MVHTKSAAKKTAKHGKESLTLLSNTKENLQSN
jgi:hypothetical protein